MTPEEFIRERIHLFELELKVQREFANKIELESQRVIEELKKQVEKHKEHILFLMDEDKDKEISRLQSKVKEAWEAANDYMSIPNRPDWEEWSLENKIDK